MLTSCVTGDEPKQMPFGPGMEGAEDCNHRLRESRGQACFSLGCVQEILHGRNSLLESQLGCPREEVAR